MRVIAGTYRRRLLKEADGATTRPTTDKNREMVFNVLGQYFDGGAALDLYAGTGAMGIEALSRGMSTCVFIDRDPTAIRTIDDNLRSLSISRERGTTVRADASAWLDGHPDARFDLVFLDPPYARGAVPEAIRMIAERRMLQPEGILVAETDRIFENVPDIAGIALFREIPAGNSKFAFYHWGARP